MTKKKKTLTVYLEEEFHNKLSELKKSKFTSKAAIVKQALYCYFDNYSKEVKEFNKILDLRDNEPTISHDKAWVDLLKYKIGDEVKYRVQDTIEIGTITNIEEDNELYPYEIDGGNNYMESIKEHIIKEKKDADFARHHIIHYIIKKI